MKKNKKIDELSQKLEAIDQQEAQNYPMTGTRRWFFRALTFGIGGAVLGKSFIAEASSTCNRNNKSCENNACYSEGNVCTEENECKMTNNCYSSNSCIEINYCNENICNKKNICGIHNSCLYSNTCNMENK
jgi:hypothetical protein